ncbi:MAG: hypothetical protein JWO66_2330 [Candidatus Eremiobacteraeota bacterium]|nr:hypothetical protein [Candidatus Eremiobacteraeota bacterium]
MASTLSDRAESRERIRPEPEADAHRWRLHVEEAQLAAHLRGDFRAYLELFGHPASDFDAAEAVYGELVNCCARHAPGAIAIEFDWDDATLQVVDACERLRTWPFSPEDTSAESTYHAYALISAMTGSIRVKRNPGGGTCVSVVLPVMRASR